MPRLAKESVTVGAFETASVRRTRNGAWTRRSVGRTALHGVGALAAIAVLGLAPADAQFDPWSVVPDDTRIVVLVDGTSVDRAPRARDALGSEGLLAKLPSRQLPVAERSRQTIAFVREGQASHPIVLTSGTSGLGKAYARLRGAKVESVAGKDVHAAGNGGWVSAVLDPSTVVEGPRQTVRAVIEQASSPGKSIASLPADKPARRLLGPGSTHPVSLLYFSPGSGTDLYSILKELDAVLHADMSASFADYQPALKMLGSTQGLRLDLGQDGDELATTLRMAMPNNVAASFASASLQAARDMARAASDAAVQTGKMSEADAGALESALSTLRTEADGDDVLVRARVADPASPRGER